MNAKKCKQQSEVWDSERAEIANVILRCRILATCSCDQGPFYLFSFLLSNFTFIFMIKLNKS